MGGRGMSSKAEQERRNLFSDMLPALHEIADHIGRQYENGIPHKYAIQAARQFTRIAVDHGYKWERVIDYVFPWLCKTEADLKSEIRRAVIREYTIYYNRLLEELDKESEA